MPNRIATGGEVKGAADSLITSSECLSKNASMAFSALSASLPLKPWPAPFERQQFRFDVRGLEAIDQPHGLFVGDILVLGAVDAQRRRRRWA